MILDPDNKYIQMINAHTPLAGTTILEIGCGNGRITADMAQYASKIVATDLDTKALELASLNNTASNVDFIYTPDGFPDLQANSFDLVIYTLSLHHIPAEKMVAHLHHSGKLLSNNGKIVVIEPGSSGSFLEVKQRFGAGSGDETAEQKSAIEAMNTLIGWELNPTQLFFVDFVFTDVDDFLSTKLPNHQKLPSSLIVELKKFLHNNTTTSGITLSSERRLNLLTRDINS